LRQTPQAPRYFDVGQQINPPSQFTGGLVVKLQPRLHKSKGNLVGVGVGFGVEVGVTRTQRFPIHSAPGQHGRQYFPGLAHIISDLEAVSPSDAALLLISPLSLKTNQSEAGTVKTTKNKTINNGRNCL